jgi:hypothetical protein
VAASIIQSSFRQKWGKLKKSVGFSFHQLSETEDCLHCKGKYGRDKKIEVIFKKNFLHSRLLH